MPKRMHVVGGTYWEVCLWPQTRQLRGSGARAAYAISALSPRDDASRPTFTSWLADDEADIAATLAESFRVRLNRQRRSVPLEWQYAQPLGVPRPYPKLQTVPDSHVVVVDECVLAFDVFETAYRINAEKLVYDPQAGSDAVSPRRKGHKWQSLALVLNLTEACSILSINSTDLAGRDDIAGIASRVREQEQAEVVVIKHMTAGAAVVDASGVSFVPSYVTDSVFPIGSGDIFSAVFSYRWAVDGAHAEEAANDASAATAFYVQERSEALPRNLARYRGGLTIAPPGSGNKRTAYLAAPFFTTAQRWLVEEIRQGLVSQGINVFSPINELGLLQGADDERSVVAGDLKAIQMCDIVFAVVDGMDAGTLFEIGFAAAQGKPTFALSEVEVPHSLTMLRGTGCHIYSDLSSAVYNAGWTARGL